MGTTLRIGLALKMMEMALSLLERSGEFAAAARLQHAIDTLAAREPTR